MIVPVCYAVYSHAQDFALPPNHSNTGANCAGLGRNTLSLVGCSKELAIGSANNCLSNLALRGVPNLGGNDSLHSYFTVVQRVSPLDSSRRTRFVPDLFSTISFTVPVTWEVVVVNDEPIVMFICISFLCCCYVLSLHD